MTMILLQSRSTGRMVAINADTIQTVHARLSTDNYRDAEKRQVAVHSPVYLAVTYVGSDTTAHFVSVNGEGEADNTVSDPDKAIRWFSDLVTQQARRIHI